MKKLTALLLVFVLTASLAGCAGKSGSNSQPAATTGTGNTTDQTTKEETKDNAGAKNIVYNVGSEPDSYDPGLSINTATVILFQQGYDFLYRLDSSGTYQPSLAESYEMSEDGLVFTFHL